MELLAPDERPKQRAWVKFRRSKSAWLGTVMVGVFVLLAITANLLAPYEADDRHREVGDVRCEAEATDAV
ncbi:MAG: hypothetical protein IH991_12320 [Planctomycetes bacterium]|nr:hypothetical protein [Planctomycetota bacterium]